MNADEFGFSREILLEGGSTRRSTLLLFAIESRTARLMQHDRPLIYASQEALEAREQAFYEALASARDLPIQPSIQDLERYAPQWLDLLPEDAVSRAGVAYALAQKHILSRSDLPQLRAALGLDTPVVAEAYASIYNEPIDSIYTEQQTLQARLRWFVSRISRTLEALPPFWLAFFLTLPIGSGLLALPTSLARVGTVPALILLFIFGLISIVTVAALAETVARSGTMRFGLGFLGHLVDEYLGSVPAGVLSIVFAVNYFLLLVVFYLGIGLTLQATTGIPSPFWFVVIAAIGFYFLSRASFNTTVSFSLVVVILSCLCVLIIFLVTLPHVSITNLLATPDQAFDPSVLQLVFGTLITAYLSHILVASFGSVVIRRDPGAAQWIKGCVAAVVAMMVINSLWLIVMNGAISPVTLAVQAGTVIEPLVTLVGPIVGVTGSFLVVISLGLVTIYASLGLYFIIFERLPALENRVPVLKAPRWKFALSSFPVVAVLLITIWLSHSNSGSFSGMLGFLGVIALPLISGVFPILLLVATRRKGDYVPALVSRLIGNRALLLLLYVIYVSLIFAYAFVIWQTTSERIITFVAGVAVIAVTAAALRPQNLKHRLVLEVQINEAHPADSSVNLIESGKVRTAPISLIDTQNNETYSAAPCTTDLTAVGAIALSITPVTAQEFKVWVHHITEAGSSVNHTYTFNVDGQLHSIQNGSVLFPCQPGIPLELRINLTG